LCVRFGGCCCSSQTAPKTAGGNQLYNTLEILMMDIMVTETCWASNKICNKKHLLHLVSILFPHNKWYIYWVCVCSLIYPACNAHASYSIFTCDLSASTIFFHVIS
jgi:hypothetical protein